MVIMPTETLCCHLSCVFAALYEQKTNLEKAMKIEQDKNKKSKDGMRAYLLAFTVPYLYSDSATSYHTRFDCPGTSDINLSAGWLVHEEAHLVFLVQ